MNLYELSSLYNNPTDILNKCRELQTPASGFDLTNWFKKILEVEGTLLVMKDHPFFGDQVILPVCHKRDHHWSSIWNFDPSRWEQSRGSLCTDFSKHIYPEKSYHLGILIRKKSKDNPQLEDVIDKMDLSFHKIFNDNGLFRDRSFPGSIMATACVDVRYFLYDGHIFCMLRKIRIRAQNRMRTVFDFEQIARNYDHDQILHERSIETEAVQVW